jgi:hypothetical protein
MHSQTIVVVFCTLFIISCRAAAILSQTPPLCEPGIIEEMPTHIKKVCVALENSNQLSNALNAYIKNEAAGENLYVILKLCTCLEKNVSRIRKKTFYLQFCMGTPEGHQKSIFNTSKVKKNKDTYIWDLSEKVCKLNPKTYKN